MKKDWHPIIRYVQSKLVEFHFGPNKKNLLTEIFSQEDISKAVSMFPDISNRSKVVPPELKNMINTKGVVALAAAKEQQLVQLKSPTKN